MQMKQQQKTAINFRLNKIRRDNTKALSEEYLSILAILYGDQIELGVKRVHQYGMMTMLEAENELRVRTIMLKGQRLRRKRELKEQHERNEREMMEELKRIK